MEFKIRFRDKIFIGIITIFLVLIGSFKLFSLLSHNEEIENLIDKRKVAFPQKEVYLEVLVANDEQGRYQGLSGIKYMDWEEGMLFVFDSSDTYAFVMRDMSFDLDFVFINGDEVVDIAKNVSHLYNGRIIGAAPYDKVLEVNAEWTRKNNIEIGDKMELR